MVGKVCVIGAGPSGLGILCWFAKQKREGKVKIKLSFDDMLSLIYDICAGHIVYSFVPTERQREK